MKRDERKKNLMCSKHILVVTSELLKVYSWAAARDADSARMAAGFLKDILEV